MLEWTLRFIQENFNVIFPVVGTLFGVLIGVFAQLLIAKVQLKHQMVLASAEKQREALQKGYAIWEEIEFAGMATEDYKREQLECFRAWWKDYCLYLPEALRKEYRTVVSHIPSMSHLNDPAKVDEIQEKVSSLGPAIEKCFRDVSGI